MRQAFGIALILLQLICGPAVFAQVVMSGRLQQPRFPGATETMPLSAIRCFATPDGPNRQSASSRTWEMHPAGWYHLTGAAGNYTIVFSTPAHFMRPIVETNIYARAGDKCDRVLSPKMDYSVHFEGAWDEKPASDYYQTFVAGGTSITQVGFKLATDGVDGAGPGSQNLLLSIHRNGNNTPDTWEQVGPEMAVLNVDCGGPKGYMYSAGWNSGEVPTVPGETYAVHLKAEKPDGTFQTFWRPDEDPATDCYRIGTAGTTGWQKHDMWLGVASDCDGLVIPCNKRVHKKFGEFAGGGRKWSQTYVARGRSLASVILYAAVSGRQPSQNRQRLAVRVRRGSHRGPIVGIEKVAIGCANYTGDASWGTFGAAFAPGEVPLEPGETYAIEFESLENWETLHDFVDIKNHPPDPNPGFNPYRKLPPDDYPLGQAFREAEHRVEFDLDMQVIEYAYACRDWARAVDDDNLIDNGDMEGGELDKEHPEKGRPEGWKPFTVDPGTIHEYRLDGKQLDNRIIRVLGGGFNNKTVDGGYVQRAVGLSHLETYRLSGRLRSSWIVDEKHRCMIGYDPTGQTEEPDADTIHWTILPDMHGIFVPYRSEPIRPVEDAISVWLRGWTSLTVDLPFEADFDDFKLQRVKTGVPPAGLQVDVMSFNIRYGSASDGENHWDNRKGLVADVLRTHLPDLVGLQEALRFQIDAIRQALPRYGEIGAGRDDGKERGEYSAILYLTDRFDVDKQGTFWLSDTPEVPGSRSWGNDIPRICTWARFIDKRTTSAFYVFNAHLDHRSQPSRERGAELIARRINQRSHHDPVLLTGDLNAAEDNPAIRYLKGLAPHIPSLEDKSAPVPPFVDTFRIVCPETNDVGTFSGFDGWRTGGKIDYVLATPSIDVIDAKIVYDNDARRYPSDHYPVTATICLPLPPHQGGTEGG